MLRDWPSHRSIGLFAFFILIFMLATSTFESSSQSYAQHDHATKQDELELRRLVIQDSKNRTRIALGTDDGQPFILLLDEKESPRLQLAIGKDGTTGIHIYTSEREGRVQLAVYSDGGSNLTLVGGNGRKNILQATNSGDLSLDLVGRGDDPLINLSSRDEGSNKLLIADSAGRSRVLLGLEKDSGAHIDLINKNGKRKRLSESKSK